VSAGNSEVLVAVRRLVVATRAGTLWYFGTIIVTDAVHFVRTIQ